MQQPQSASRWGPVAHGFLLGIAVPATQCLCRTGAAILTHNHCGHVRREILMECPRYVAPAEIAAVSEPAANPPSTGLSLGIGTGLVLLGVTVTVLATVRHVRFLHSLARGEPYRPLAGSVAGVLSLIGILMVGYLLMRG